MNRSTAEIARLFNASTGAPSNAGEEIYPGHPGYVVAEGEVRSMVWGFPLSLRGKSGQKLKPKPVNNARTDKLDSGFWKASFRDRRCLIPVTAFAEAEGPKGGKTRTWFTVPGSNAFVCAGLWRDSAEWGAVYSMIMTDANETVARVHNRMPVILAQENWSRWLDAEMQEARELCRPFDGELAVERTSDPWVRKRSG